MHRYVYQVVGKHWPAEVTTVMFNDNVISAFIETVNRKFKKIYIFKKLNFELFFSSFRSHGQVCV